MNRLAACRVIRQVWIYLATRHYTGEQKPGNVALGRTHRSGNDSQPRRPIAGSGHSSTYKRSTAERVALDMIPEPEVVTDD